jgi:hypothetical protein
MAVYTSYNKPDVTIIQEIVNPSTTLAEPDLIPCVVGLCYQVERDLDAGLYQDASALFSYPSLIVGADVEESSVVVKVVKDDQTDVLDSSNYVAGSTGVTLDAGIIINRAMVDATGTEGYVEASDATFTDANAKFITWGVVDGDVLTVLGTGTNAGDYTVSSVYSEHSLIVDSTFSVIQSNIDYAMTKVDHIGLGLGAEVLVSYRALRSDLDDVGMVESLEDASSQLGRLIPENPLGYGVFCAIANTVTQVKYLAVTEDTQEAHAAAADVLTSHEVYAIVPLTQNTSAISVWKTHVDEMSDPSEKMERIVLVNRPLPLRESKIYLDDADASSAGGNFYYVDRAGAGFQSNGVSNGDLVYFAQITEVSSVLDQTSYVVREVVSEDRVKVYSSTSIVGAKAYLSVCSPDHTRYEQSSHIRDYASSIEDKRVIVVWPDQVLVTPETTQTTVPGYFLAAAIAGAVSSLPAQQSLTRLRLSGFDRLLRSNLGFFTQSQLDNIASGGVMICIQQSSGALPEVRHQLTTNMTAVEYRELSIVKNVDLIAKYLRETVRPMAGSNNITDFFIKILRVGIESVFENLKVSDGASGPNIISGEVVSLEQNESSPDRIDVIVDLVIPYPANDIRITLRI